MVDEHVIIIPNTLLMITEMEEVEPLTFPPGYKIVIKKTKTPDVFRIIIDSSRGEFFKELENIGRPRPVFAEELPLPLAIKNPMRLTRRYIKLSDTDFVALKLLHA